MAGTADMAGTAGMNERELGQIRDLAEAAARSAGSLARSMHDVAASDPDTKSSSVDLVTLADKAAEAELVSSILNTRPDDSIVGEEGADHRGSSGVRWIIDPIDGTTNYVYGRIDYCVSIGVEVDDSIVVGVVYQPATDRLFSAVIGQGAFVNGEPLTCNRPTSLGVSLVATGFGYKPERRQAQALVLTSVLPAVRDIRRGGSAALDLCAVATGDVDAYYERGLNYWDMAAGWRIAVEAGAIVGGLNAERPDESFLVAGSPTIFPALRSLLQSSVVDE